jgi:hypothetical protein
MMTATIASGRNNDRDGALAGATPGAVVVMYHLA